MSEPRLKRLHYRAWHRGTRELDLILGRFADRNLPAMGPDEIEAFEAVLEAADPDIHDWVLHGAEAPAAIAAMIGRLRESISAGVRGKAE